MDRKLASEIMPIIQAYSEGKVIEMSTLLGWVKQDDLNIDLLIANPNMFRIQPMITYRPFKDGDDLYYYFDSNVMLDAISDDTIIRYLEHNGYECELQNDWMPIDHIVNYPQAEDLWACHEVSGLRTIG